MRLRILVTAAAVVGLSGAGTSVVRGAGPCAMDHVCCVEHHACCTSTGQSCCSKETGRQSSITNFMNTVMVKRTLVSGPVLIVHDDAKMARGEPCTTFYRFDPTEGPKEALVSFHCTPRKAAAVSRTTFTTASTGVGIPRLVEYQIAGDTEAHGIPR